MRVATRIETFTDWETGARRTMQLGYSVYECEAAEYVPEHEATLKMYARNPVYPTMVPNTDHVVCAEHVDDARTMIAREAYDITTLEHEIVIEPFDQPHREIALATISES